MKKFKQVLAVGMVFAVGVGGICVTRLNAASTTFEQLKEENTNLSHKVATEGMVLLKNDSNSLLLKNGDKVAVFGKGQIDFIKGGTGSGDVVAEYVRNVIQGLEMKGNKVKINQNLKEKYQNNRNYKPSENEVRNAAKESDTAIVIITRNSGEGGDRSAGKGDYYLSDDETTLLDRINKAGFNNVTVVLNIGGIMDTSWIANYPAVKSVLLAWQPGMEGGLAVADILCGDVNPSGKLTDTFAKNYNDYSTSNDYRENDWYLTYDEDIFIGYRYFETFDPTYDKVNYEFGYGLSYTDFRMSDVKVTNNDKNINVSAKVTNVGDVAGKEVVQVYFSAPQGKLGKPGKELAAYAKTKLLNPGESEVLNLSYAISDMSSYDDTGKVQKSAYLLEAGVYEIYVGNSIKNAGEHGARGTYFVKETTVTEQLTEEYAPIQLEKRLLADGTYEDLETFYEDESDKVCLDVAGDKITKIEAEDFFHKHRYDEVDSNDDYTIFGLNNVTGEGNHWSSYALDIEKAGTYEIRLKIANSRTVEDDNSVKIYIDDVEQKNTEKVKISNTGGDWKLKEFGPITVKLPEGKHFLKFEFTNGGNNKGGFDYFTLKPKNVNTNEVVSNWKGKNYGNQGEKKVVIPESGAILLQDVAENPSKMDDFMKQLTDQEMADLCRGHGTNLSYANTGCIGNLRKYGIPGAETADGPAGVRFNKNTPDTINGGNANISTTAWPIGTLVACTWNTPLIEDMGVAMGREAKHYKIDIMLAPGMNIHYNPLCGRNFEYYSEDPVVAGKTAAALARGMQTQKVACTIKHFAGNHKETNREYVDSRMSERTLREIYLKGFEIAVKEGDPWCIMSCYNRINGEEPAQKADLLTDILRKEWGYNGIVMSDWNNDSSSYTEILAGNDVKMVNNETRQVRGALATGRMSREALETSARRILEMIIKTNALEKFENFTYEIKSGSAIRLEAENYSDKESQLGFETCTDDGGGRNSTAKNGGWLAFRINVKDAGTYTLKARTAYTNGKVKAKIKVDNKEVGTIDTNTGSSGYQDWKTTGGIDIRLEKGSHTLRYEFQNGYNLNWIELKKK